MQIKRQFAHLSSRVRCYCYSIVSMTIAKVIDLVATVLGMLRAHLSRDWCGRRSPRFHVLSSVLAVVLLYRLEVTQKDMPCRAINAVLISSQCGSTNSMHSHKSHRQTIETGISAFRSDEKIILRDSRTLHPVQLQGILFSIRSPTLKASIQLRLN